MDNKNQLKWKLICVNALLVGVIVFLSALGTGTDYIIVLPSAILAGLLRFLIEMQDEIKEEISDIKRKCKPGNYETSTKETSGNIHKLKSAFFF